MIEILIDILTLGIKPLYDKNIEYYRIIEEFRNKLPRHQKQAKYLTGKEKSNLLTKSTKMMTVLDVSKHAVSIEESTIDEFYNKLNNFNYSWVINKEYYKKYTRNLNRFNPLASDKNFDLAMIQLILNEDPLHPLKPWPFFIYHLKWKYNITSTIYNLLRKDKLKY